LKAVPAVCADGVPLLPLPLPGAAASPGTNSCNLAKMPALTVIDGLVLCATAPLLTSVALTVAVPAVLSVTLKLRVPPTSAASLGKVALVSDEVISTVSVTLVTRFQNASTALTVIMNTAPAVCALGAPVLPLAVP